MFLYNFLEKPVFTFPPTIPVNSRLSKYRASCFKMKPSGSLCDFLFLRILCQFKLSTIFYCFYIPADTWSFTWKKKTRYSGGKLAIWSEARGKSSVSSFTVASCTHARNLLLSQDRRSRARQVRQRKRTKQPRRRREKEKKKREKRESSKRAASSRWTRPLSSRYRPLDRHSALLITIITIIIKGNWSREPGTRPCRCHSAFLVTPMNEVQLHVHMHMHAFDSDVRRFTDTDGFLIQGFHVTMQSVCPFYRERFRLICVTARYFVVPRKQPYCFHVLSSTYVYNLSVYNDIYCGFDDIIYFREKFSLIVYDEIFHFIIFIYYILYFRKTTLLLSCIIVTI